MLYLNEEHLIDIGASWKEVVKVIKESTKLIASNDFAQPIKPYLRYGNLTNRIIAMPSYIGGEYESAGIKWIASFPGNLEKGIQRAHSVTILNEASTGKPSALINTNYISGIRTAGVSGFVIDEWNKAVKRKEYQIGIVGFGPIGRMHLQMIVELIGISSIGRIAIYDIRDISSEKIPEELRSRVDIVNDWESAYEDADIFVTATVSYEAYISKKPKPGSLQLNVSLRDYKPEYLQYVDKVIVDNWEEVCRENTDIENMHKEQGLQKEQTLAITDLIDPKVMESIKDDDVVMFNPMGMAVYDIALGAYYLERAKTKDIGVHLN